MNIEQIKTALNQMMNGNIVVSVINVFGVVQSKTDDFEKVSDAIDNSSDECTVRIWKGSALVMSMEIYDEHSEGFDVCAIS